MKRGSWLFVAGVLGVVLGGTLVALAYSYPKGETALRSYCTRCGTVTARSREHALLGARREGSTKSSMLTRVLGLPPGDHEHVWVEPWAHVFPTYNSKSAPELGTPAALRDTLLGGRLRELDVLGETPHAIAVLDAAMKQDPARTRVFIARLLDFERHYPMSAVSLLDRPEDWPARWAAVDAFDRAYRCQSQPLSLRCTLTTGGRPHVVLQYEANGRGQMSVPSLKHWSP